VTSRSGTFPDAGGSTCPTSYAPVQGSAHGATPHALSQPSRRLRCRRRAGHRTCLEPLGIRACFRYRRLRAG
jgi:hypothetical protein